MNPSTTSSTSQRRKTLTSSTTSSANAGSNGGGRNKYDATRKKIERMETEREERRKEMIQRKQAKMNEHAKLLAAGNPGDVDFIGMVEEWRVEQAREHEESRLHQQHLHAINGTSSNIIVAVRKRPMSDKERKKLDHDSVSCYPPKVWIHSAKFKVDGITKYLTHTGFQFDHAFADGSTTDQIYLATTMPLVDHVVSTQGRATVFCYGQTGSGKTYTMSGIQQILAHDLFGELRDQGIRIEITVAFFELYGGYIQDLLHDRKRCKLLEDGKGEVNITGLREVPAPSATEFLKVIEAGHSQRTTHTTEANDCSSRSHAICQVFLRDPSSGKLRGKLTLVDLAGSERGSDTKSHNLQRRSESAEINTSLLSLKECIRALGQKSAHVPYRGSKLTLILKDCFSADSKTTMIATVSPGASATDHSLNTLRYADRIKEQRITSTTKKSTHGISTPGMSVCSAPPSQQRLARIAASLGWNPENSEQIDVQGLLSSRNKTLSPTGLVEPAADSNSSQSVSTLSAELSDAEDIFQESEESEDLKFRTNMIEDGSNRNAEPTQEEEAEMRRTVQALFELEEALLNQHMSNIQENAEMLTQEGRLLQLIQQGGGLPDDEEMDSYAIQLAEFLDRKEALIMKLQSKLDEFHVQLSCEQQLAQRVTRLTQY